MMTSPVVPSITLQITKRDAERFLDASESLIDALKDLESRFNDGVKRENASDLCDSPPHHSCHRMHDPTNPLFENLFQAAQVCKHHFIKAFLAQMTAFDISSIEVRLSVLLFANADKTTKLRHYYDALGDENATLNYQGILALFRSILLALTCCVHLPEQGERVVVEGRPSPERPAKRVKREAKSPRQEFRDCQSPSFDSSLATLHDEEESSFASLRREIEEVTTFATDELLKFCKTDQVSFAMFGEWYNSSGAAIVPWLELLQPSKWNKGQDDIDESPGSLETEDGSPILISFDFSGSDNPASLFISISEDNLVALHHLVDRTGLMLRPAADLCKALLRVIDHRKTDGERSLLIHRDNFCRALDQILPEERKETWSRIEKEVFDKSFLDFYSCFEASDDRQNAVNFKELAIGMCFFCAGNKSTKLATGFELLDDKNRGHLSQKQLFSYLRSYLLALVALSFFMPISRRKSVGKLSSQRKKAIAAAVESGAKWTLGHFLNSLDLSDSSIQDDKFTFETFANWYSSGGYNVAPWLELLDLNKVLSLINQSKNSTQLPSSTFPDVDIPETQPRDRISSLRRHHSNRRGPPPEVLFTFPMANRRPLVVLRDDANYVREVVEQLGLLLMTPNELWDLLFKSVAKRRKPKKDEVAVYVNSATFVECMEEICPRQKRKRSLSDDTVHITAHSSSELLSNFFQCFDISQTDRVALDELMGGLALLCGGKKSWKLAFAFGIFDTRPGIQKHKEPVIHSLSGEDLFLFLRSILIVTFSCCRQSLDLSDEVVGRCIADTANMICNDVMRHQWETKQTDRLTFDEFGHWYNDGGFERAPWLELLDLKKWVLVDDYNTLQKQAPGAGIGESRATSPPLIPETTSVAIPPPPPEDSLDPSFFDENGIMPMDSMDEMDMILMQQPSMDEGTSPHLVKSFSFSPRQRGMTDLGPPASPLKFQLNTIEAHGGYKMSLSRARIAHFKRILEESGIYQTSVEESCNAIFSKATGGKGDDDPRISKQDYDVAMRTIRSWGDHNDESSQRTLERVTSEIFDVFAAATGKSKPSAVAIACGFTVLCHGKKSDKLEYAFEMLDKNKKGYLSRNDMAKYLQSFLSVLLTIAFSPSLDNDPRVDSLATMEGDTCERSIESAARVVRVGADWAASLAFQDVAQMSESGSKTSMSFDDFADWYTSKGHVDIPWLELIDLRKWVMINS